MQLETLHTWHVRFESDTILYHVSWTKLTDRFRLAGFTVNPLPGTPYALSVAHTHPGAMTLFSLKHPDLLLYVIITEAPCAGV